MTYTGSSGKTSRSSSAWGAVRAVWSSIRSPGTRSASGPSSRTASRVRRHCPSDEMAPWCESAEDVDRLTRRLHYESGGSPFLAVTLLHGLENAPTLKDDLLGCFDVTDDAFARMTKTAMSIADEYSEGRLVSLLEGGYNVDGQARAVEAHVGTLGG